MKRRVLYYHALALGSACLLSLVSLASTRSIDHTMRIKDTREAQLYRVASIIFNPILPDGQGAKNPYPTISIYEKAVDEIYGPQGLAVDGQLLDHIKKFYFYLEYVVKVERAAQLIQQGITHALPIDQTMQHGWKAYITALTTQVGAEGMRKVQEIVPTADAYNKAVQYCTFATWQEVPRSEFWTTAPVTYADVLRSAIWQNFSKYEVTQAFVNTEKLLPLLAQMNANLFFYVPNMDITYYHRDFTYMRLSMELFRMQLDLNELTCFRYAQDIDDWRSVIDTSHVNASLVKIEEYAQKFRNEPLYTFLSDASRLIAESKDGIITYPPHIKSYLSNPYHLLQLYCFSMYKNLQARLYLLLDSDFVEKNGKLLEKNILQKTRPSLLPLVFADFAYLKDISYIQGMLSAAATHDQELRTTDISAGQLTSKKTSSTASVQRVDSTQSPRVAVVPQSNANVFSKEWQQGFKKWVSGHGQQIVQSGKQIWTDVGTAALQSAQITKSIGLAIGKSFKDIGLMASDNPFAVSEQVKHSRMLRDGIVTDMTKVTTDTRELLKTLNRVAKESSSIVGNSIAIGLNALIRNNEVSDSLGKMVASGLNIIIDYEQLFVDAYVTMAPALVAVGYDAILLLTDVIGLSIRKGIDAQYNSWSSDILNSLSSVANTVMATVLANCTYLLTDRVIGAVQSAIELTGYLTLALTDMTVELVSSHMYQIAHISQANKDVQQQIYQELREHRRFLATIVNTALIIGATIITEGATLPALGFSIGSQAVLGGPMYIGSFQEDEEMKEKKRSRKKHWNSMNGLSKTVNVLLNIHRMRFLQSSAKN